MLLAPDAGISTFLHLNHKQVMAPSTCQTLNSIILSDPEYYPIQKFLLNAVNPLTDNRPKIVMGQVQHYLLLTAVHCSPSVAACSDTQPSTSCLLHAAATGIRSSKLSLFHTHRHDVITHHRLDYGPIPNVMAALQI